MNNRLARQAGSEDEFRAAAVRDQLEEIRRLADQSRLLALNAMLESAGARAARGPSGEMDALAAQASGAAAEADKAASAVDALLEQIQAGSSFARHCG